MKTTSLTISGDPVSSSVKVGNFLEFAPYPPWWVQAWRWLLYVLLGRRPAHWFMVTAVDDHTSTVTIDSATEPQERAARARRGHAEVDKP